MATSDVDSTFPADNVKVDKSDFRAQMLIIKNELNDLFARTGVAGAMAFYDFITRTDVAVLIESKHLESSYARDLALKGFDNVTV